MTGYTDPIPWLNTLTEIRAREEERIQLAAAGVTE
jgi:hypothetical protein